MALERRVGRLLLAGVVLVTAAGAADAAESGARNGTVIAARIELQQAMDEWLGRSLSVVADPYRLRVTSQLEVRGAVREVVQREETPGSEMKIGASQSLRLPGLGVVEKPVSGPSAPDIQVKIPGRKTAQVRRELETEVARITLRLFVDPRMPEDRREIVRTAAAEMVGLDPARGDTIAVAELAAEPPQRVQIGLAEVYPWTLGALCGTALVCALVLALAIARGGRAGRALLDGGGRGPGVEREGAAAGPVAAAEHAPPARGGPRSFAALDGASPEELAQLLGELEPRVAAVVLDRGELPPAAVRAVFERFPRERQVEVAAVLAAGRAVDVAALRGMETAAESALARIRSTVPVGGPERLAGLLAHAPASAQHHVLQELAARTPELASALRRELLLFEDLATLSDAAVRQLVTSLDPGVVARALLGAPPEVRGAVHRAVSKRLRGILEVEEETTAEASPAEVEAARKAVEAAMRGLRPARAAPAVAA
jgi:hypothetical protein